MWAIIRVTINISLTYMVYNENGWPMALAIASTFLGIEALCYVARCLTKVVKMMEEAEREH